MKKGRGRPKNHFPAEIIEEIIYRYTKEQKVTGKMSYMDVYRFSKELFENGEIEYQIGEFFWRKGEGRTIIDRTNQVMQHNVSNDMQEDASFVDTKTTIEKLFTGKQADKDKLIRSLKINEIKLLQFIKKVQKLEKELNSTKLALEKEKETSKEYKNKADAYEETLFQWMELSISKDIPLTNLLSTGQQRTPEVAELLKSTLSENPIAVFNHMNKIKKNHSAPEIKKWRDNVTSLDPQKKVTKSALDDIDF